MLTHTLVLLIKIRNETEVAENHPKVRVKEDQKESDRIREGKNMAKRTSKRRSGRRRTKEGTPLIKIVLGVVIGGLMLISIIYGSMFLLSKKDAVKKNAEILTDIMKDTLNKVKDTVKQDPKKIVSQLERIYKLLENFKKENGCYPDHMSYSPTKGFNLENRGAFSFIGVKIFVINKQMYMYMPTNSSLEKNKPNSYHVCLVPIPKNAWNEWDKAYLTKEYGDYYYYWLVDDGIYRKQVSEMGMFGFDGSMPSDIKKDCELVKRL